MVAQSDNEHGLHKNDKHLRITMYDKKTYFIVSCRCGDKLNKIKWFTNISDATQWIDGLEWAVGFDVDVQVTIDKRMMPAKIDDSRQMSFLEKGE